MPAPQRTSMRRGCNHLVIEDRPPPRSARHRVAATAAAALMLVQLTLLGTGPAVAAPGDLVADVIINEQYPDDISPSVAFDGTYLYHTGYGASVLHRINVPAAGTTQRTTPSGTARTPASASTTTTPTRMRRARP